MPDVVRVVASSLTFYNGCVKGFELLRKARHYKADLSSVRLQIEIAQHALFTWAEEAGITQDNPVLLIAADKAPLVPKILAQLSTLLTDLQQLKRRYGLELETTSENIETVETADLFPSGRSKNHEEYTSKTDIAVPRAKASPWKRLRWLSVDDKKVSRLLNEANCYISTLEKFLEQTKRTKRDHAVEIYLRNAVLSSDNPRELNAFSRVEEQPPSKLAIAAAARVKQTRLQLGLSESLVSPICEQVPLQQQAIQRSLVLHRRTRSWDSSVNMKLSIGLLYLSREARACPLRAMTIYDGRPVLLEWKYVTRLDLPTLEDRVNQVASFLHELDYTFHSLPCRGYVIDHEAIRYGYIFDLSNEDLSNSQIDMNNLSHPSAPSLTSLRQMFASQAASPPSLNERLSISIMLLEALLNLHTSGWLHKDLRSDNIIFIQKYRPREDKRLDLASYSLYIAGYVCSRADQPDEMTEPFYSEAENDLYRHPHLLGPTKKPFCKAFDMFTVGCTLIEIALWSSLTDILKQHADFPLTIRHSEWAMGGTTPLNDVNRVSNVHNDRADLRSVDHMELRDKLLLSCLNKSSVLDISKKGPILRALATAVGRRYASVVEDLLEAACHDSNGIDEHEYALEVEVRARNALQEVLDII
jgi:hypothetical protein